MRTHRKYHVGDIINDRVIIKVDGRFAIAECLKCGRIRKTFPSEFSKMNCICRKKDSGRFSGKIYKNTTEKLQRIKEKYKNGVTTEHITEMLNSLIG
ncbi:MAG: hypothetical protein KBT02_00080 [Treponema sp.]|nr:hypothetical protein [Candidatus Treponema caballi]